MKEDFKPQTILFFGRSGCGKGTQVEFLIKYLKENDPQKRKVIYVETGNLAREFSKTDSYTAKLNKETIDNGGLLPEFIPIWLWGTALVNNVTGDEHLIMEGLARRLPEAPVLKTALEFYKKTDFKVIHINVSREWAMERLLARGRNDDSLAGANKRQDWFDKHVIPAIKYFKNCSDVTSIEINGEQSKEKVHEDIVRAISR